MTHDYAARLNALRDILRQSNYDGFLIPMADEYQSEYVPSSAQRIAFLCGFTGSAGFVIVLRGNAAFFTDGRYTLQAKQQIDSNLFEIYDSSEKAPSQWLEENVKPNMRVGFDPWLHTYDGIDRYKKTLSKKNAELIPVLTNPLDVVWTDRPSPPTAPIFAYDVIFSGKSSRDKRRNIAEQLTKNQLSAAVLTDPSSIAWLLNIRGSDVPNTPLPLSFAILRADASVKWFVHPRKITSGLAAHLGEDVEIEHIEQFLHALDRLAAESNPVHIDPSEAASQIVERLKEARVKLDLGDDPCTLPKACKNSVEVDGMRAAHRRDGAALVKFLCWLESAQTSGNVTELSAEAKLSEFRSEHKMYRGPSFDTIAGVGAHGAIVHYRATHVTNRTLETGQLFLLDSGGQYLDGTTDVTRTLSLGVPTAEMRDRFTRVLKGHIALASIRFPEGTTGGELDVLARQYLWAIGLDYSHGTGHGVGSYLGVHEGPQSISKRSKVPLLPGMVVSNEPGYYKAGEYGIRIENLQVIVPVTELISADRKIFGFESLTLVPIDRRLIENSLLTSSERQWLNSYHAHVRNTLCPLLDEDAAQWLDAATTEI